MHFTLMKTLAGTSWGHHYIEKLDLNDPEGMLLLMYKDSILQTTFYMLCPKYIRTTVCFENHLPIACKTKFCSQIYAIAIPRPFRVLKRAYIRGSSLQWLGNRVSNEKNTAR